MPNMANEAASNPRLRALVTLLKALAPFSELHAMIGGWVPYFLLEQHGRTGWNHVGSLDLDFVFDPSRLTPERRDEIRSALSAIGARPRRPPNASFYFEDSFLVPIEHDGQQLQIQVDLMGIDIAEGETFDWRSRTLMAIRHSETIEVRWEGETLPFRVSNAAAMVCLKALALSERTKPKDAYDLYTLLLYYKDGPETLAREMIPVLESGPPARFAMRSLRKRFRNSLSEGPQMVVDFLMADAPLEDQIVLRNEVAALFQILFTALGPDWM